MKSVKRIQSVPIFIFSIYCTFYYYLGGFTIYLLSLLNRLLKSLIDKYFIIWKQVCYVQRFTYIFRHVPSGCGIKLLSTVSSRVPLLTSLTVFPYLFFKTPKIFPTINPIPTAEKVANLHYFYDRCSDKNTFFGFLRSDRSS